MPRLVSLLVWATALPLVGSDRILLNRLGPSGADLFIAKADGTAERKLLANSELDYNPSFSKDGNWIIFTSERNGSADIYRVRVDGSDLERLTDDPAYDDQAALSPNGTLLAFVSSRGSGSSDVWILDLKTRKLRNVTNAPGGDFRPVGRPTENGLPSRQTGAPSSSASRADGSTCTPPAFTWCSRMARAYAGSHPRGNSPGRLSGRRMASGSSFTKCPWQTPWVMATTSRPR